MPHVSVAGLHARELNYKIFLGAHVACLTSFVHDGLNNVETSHGASSEFLIKIQDFDTVIINHISYMI